MPTPRGREKNITGQSKSMERRGEGLGTGPVGKVAKGLISVLLNRLVSGGNSKKGKF